MVRAHSGPPKRKNSKEFDIERIGGLAQLGERLPCKQEVSGSIPLISTNQFEIGLKRLSVKRFNLALNELERTLKTEQCDEKQSEVRQQRGFCAEKHGKRKSYFNCGTTSEKMRVTITISKICEACIIHNREQEISCFRLVKL